MSNLLSTLSLTQKKLLRILGDGKDHTFKELINKCCPGITTGGFNVHISRLRDKLKRENPYLDIDRADTSADPCFRLILKRAATIRDCGLREI